MAKTKQVTIKDLDRNREFTASEAAYVESYRHGKSKLRPGKNRYELVTPVSKLSEHIQNRLNEDGGKKKAPASSAEGTAKTDGKPDGKEAGKSAAKDGGTKSENSGSGQPAEKQTGGSESGSKSNDKQASK